MTGPNNDFNEAEGFHDNRSGEIVRMIETNDLQGIRAVPVEELQSMSYGLIEILLAERSTRDGPAYSNYEVFEYIYSTGIFSVEASLYDMFELYHWNRSSRKLDYMLEYMWNNGSLATWRCLGTLNALYYILLIDMYNEVLYDKWYPRLVSIIDPRVVCTYVHSYLPGGEPDDSKHSTIIGTAIASARHHYIPDLLNRGCIYDTMTITNKPVSVLLDKFNNSKSPERLTDVYLTLKVLSETHYPFESEPKFFGKLRTYHYNDDQRIAALFSLPVYTYTDFTIPTELNPLDTELEETGDCYNYPLGQYLYPYKYCKNLEIVAQIVRFCNEYVQTHPEYQTEEFIDWLYYTIDIRIVL